MSQTTEPTSREDGRPTARGAAYQTAARTAAVAAVFSAIVCGFLLHDYSLRRAQDPHDAASYRMLKLAFAQQPDSQELKAQIRALDEQLRREYFQRRAFARVGGQLLLAGVAILLVATTWAVTLRRELPVPKAQAAPVDTETRWTRIARWGVTAVTIVLAGVGIGLLRGASRNDLPDDVLQVAALLKPDPAPPSNPPQVSPQGAPQVAPGPPLPSEDEFRKMWPSFRGPEGAGISAYTNVPDSWDDASGKNIRWKTPVPLPGLNSPVVWGDRVFLSGAIKGRREVYCFDAKTGKLAWQKPVPPHPQAGQMREPEFSGYAASTVATDGRFVFAIFVDGQLAAFDLQGQPLWQKSLGIPENNYGHASSLVTYRDLLLVQLDQGTKKKPKSKLYAFRGATGQKAWEVPRPVAVCWTSPIVISHGGRDQVVTYSDPWVIAYNPADGAELWKASCIMGESGPSPVFSAGIVYAGNTYCQLSAIRADGTGDVTKTHIVWSGEQGLPEVCSPLATSEYVFLLDSGTLTCYDAKDGTILWEEYEAFDYADFTSSPSLVGNRVYLFGDLEKEGETDEEKTPLLYCKSWIVEPSRQGCKIVAEGQLGESCVTSPAFQDGCIYIRGDTHLFCIAEKQ